jgi:hypothetical protein
LAWLSPAKAVLRFSAVFGIVRVLLGL